MGPALSAMVVGIGIAVAIVRVTSSAGGLVQNAGLPADIERAVSTRVSGALDPHPALVADLARRSRTGETKVRSQLLAHDPTLEAALVEALGSADDRVALGACAWMCGGGVPAAVPERAFRAEAGGRERDRRRALAAVAASCAGPPGTGLAHEALIEGGPVALGGAYALWRLGVPLTAAEASVLPVELAGALSKQGGP